MSDFQRDFARKDYVYNICFYIFKQLLHRGERRRRKEGRKKEALEGRKKEGRRYCLVFTKDIESGQVVQKLRHDYLEWSLS